MQLGEGGLAGLQDLARLPLWPNGASGPARMNLILEEAAIRAEFMSYAYAYDNHDLDAVLDHFTEDCVIDNPRGQVAGAEAIRANYRVLFGYWKTTRHMWSNIAVRFVDATPTQAYVGAYHHAVLLSDERTLAGAGTDVRRLEKVGESWKIARRWITDDVDYTVDVFHGPVEDPDKVDKLKAGAGS
jgi:ketosteroid isomerase-like protein